MTNAPTKPTPWNRCAGFMPCRRLAFARQLNTMAESAEFEQHAPEDLPMKMTACLLAAPLAAFAGASTPSPSVSPVHTFASLVIAPAGDRLASVENQQSLTSAEQLHGPVVIRAARDGHWLSTSEPCAACGDGGLAWSPDGKSLAFLAANGAAGTVEVLLARDGGVKTIAPLQGVGNTPRFSPDGRTLAMLATVAAKKKIGALEAGVEQVGDIGAAPDEQRIAVVPIAGGELAFITPDDTFIYEYDWTPDGKGFVATAAKGDGDNNWWLAEIDAFDLAKGAPRQIVAPDYAKYQISMPRMAPDGKSVEFVGGLM